MYMSIRLYSRIDMYVVLSVSKIYSGAGGSPAVPIHKLANLRFVVLEEFELLERKHTELDLRIGNSQKQ